MFPVQGRSGDVFKMTCFPLYLLHTGELVFIKVARLTGTNEWHIKGLSSLLNFIFRLIHSCTFCMWAPIFLKLNQARWRKEQGPPGAGEGPGLPGALRREVKLKWQGAICIVFKHKAGQPAQNVSQTLLLRRSQGAPKFKFLSFRRAVTRMSQSPTQRTHICL